ncbi:MAG TPA: c-type cytochrome [Campylobacterales bacterium]|nr:c-type cytochrome [Campylobacterales bacterium]
MKKLLILVAILSQGLIASDVEAGKEKFNSTCVACHGAKAERKALGISQVIAEIGNKEVIEGLLRNIRDNGKESGKNMAMVNTVSGLSDVEIGNLSAYIATLATVEK